MLGRRFTAAAIAFVRAWLDGSHVAGQHEPAAGRAEIHVYLGLLARDLAQYRADAEVGVEHEP